MKYRPNVAALCSIGEVPLRHVLACIRKDNHAVQCVQGGIEYGEDPKQAVCRELKEELGIEPSDFMIQYTSSKVRYYTWPPDVPKKQGFVGQEQTWFHIHIPEFKAVQLNLSCAEFTAVLPVTISELVQHTVKWKREVFVDFLDELGIQL